MQELSEEGSRRIVTGDCPINAGKDAEAMRVDGMGNGGAREGGACICFDICTVAEDLMLGRLYSPIPGSVSSEINYVVFTTSI